ncbi:STAS domain-containing protein [Acidovorax sp. HDW3]|uniref:STAS domain-containing protein n=1 Tax=Acidovorax sp. HDW3 TaxID=2714923 RepID=UPI0014079A8A|nr:STAS domain-containing protein [Acidovorax sp. HDW3]QIL44825.1 STAS domain-containing protein [Acidovorax sp. HDW3]
MSQEEPNAGGLLSKMVRFVRNPTVNWTELDNIEAERESQYSKQMLKEMIERKRRNDFVRKREFDQLRKLRQRGSVASQRTEDPMARPSFFQSSMTSPGERAVTLKKIDEIEAQMSQQWWKNKPTTGMGSTAPMSLPSEPITAPFLSTAPLSTIAAMPATVQPLFTEEAAQAAPGRSSAPAAPPLVPSPAPSPVATVAPPPPAEPEVFVHEPDLEEAAIRFASGDHEGAEAGLKEVLAQHQQDDPQQQFDIWMTLFDLYRATGLREPFEALSLDFAARFSRSAPLWFSLPEQLGAAAAPASTDAVPAVPARSFSWSAPGALTLQSIAALQATLARAAAPWTLNWARLMTIDEAALPALTKLMGQWADQDVQLQFNGVEALASLLQSKTVSGERAQHTDWWHLRMAALRLMGALDEFEMVALDYCVTYEVSPPSWVVPRCSYAGDDGQVSGQAGAAPAPESLLQESQFSPSALLQEPEAPRPRLSGVIEGDAEPLLAPLLALVKPGQPLLIGCEQLVRVDFPAAGSVLNWAAEQQAAGQAVQFINLHRLVAVLFNVIGINEHAWIVPRKN